MTGLYSGGARSEALSNAPTRLPADLGEYFAREREAILTHPSGWEYLIVAKDAWKGGERLPNYVGPFPGVKDATAWGEANIERGEWHITDIAGPAGWEYR